MTDLTWDDLDWLAESDTLADTIALRDRAWAEIVRLRAEHERLLAEHSHAIRELRALRDLEDAADAVLVNGAFHAGGALAPLLAARTACQVARKRTGGAR